MDGEEIIVGGKLLKWLSKIHEPMTNIKWILEKTNDFYFLTGRLPSWIPDENEHTYMYYPNTKSTPIQFIEFPIDLDEDKMSDYFFTTYHGYRMNIPYKKGNGFCAFKSVVIPDELELEIFNTVNGL